MKITYLGTAAAEGIPAVFCNCKTCQNARKNGGKDIRTRCQAMINDDFLLDYPPDSYLHSLACGVSFDKVKYLAITHSHMDHFYPQDFIVRGDGYSHGMRAPRILVLAGEQAQKIFHEFTKYEITPASKQAISFITPAYYKPQTFGPYEITPLPAFHKLDEAACIYLIRTGGKSILYAHDTGELYDEVYQFLSQKPLDLVSLDATFGPIACGGGHMGFANNQTVINRLREIGCVGENTLLVANHFTHNCHSLHADLVREAKKYGLLVAYDGFTLEI